MLRRILQFFCLHQFRLGEQRLTGIPQPEKPGPGASMADWQRWGEEVVCGRHPWHTERIAWSCCRCSKEFRAHCGLDILSRHGTVAPRNP